jgi:hypothetical protein
MKHLSKVVIFSVFLMLVGCGKTNETPNETKTVEAPIVVTPKETPTINEDDAKLIKHYGACGSILKAAIHLINQNEIKDGLGGLTHQATIYTILTAQIIQKYPQSLHENGIKIANQFLVENIFDKTFDGKKINQWKKDNDDCILEEVSLDKIEEIFIVGKERYDMVYKENSSL